MSDWVSGFTALAGVALGFVGQWLADHRARTRAQEDRQEATKVRRFEIEQGELRRLQDQARQLHLASNAIISWMVEGGDGPMPSELDQPFWDAHTEVELLVSRISDDHTREIGREWLKKAFQMKIGQTAAALEDHLDAYTELIDASGEALRMDPVAIASKKPTSKRRRRDHDDLAPAD